MLLTAIVAVNCIQEDLNTHIHNTLLEQQKQLMEVMLRTHNSNARAADLTKCDTELTKKNDESLTVYTTAMALCRTTYDTKLVQVDAKYNNARTDTTRRGTDVCSGLYECKAKPNNEFFSCVSKNVSDIDC